MKTNWFAINRSIVENELFVKKPLWGWAWVQILAKTDYKTAQVCLTEVYRDLSNHFSYAQWRHMINVFVKEGMLEINETVNLGDRAGHRQLATVSNWSKYQSTAQSEQQSEHSAGSRANTEQNDVQGGKNGTSTQSEHRASSSASTERVAVSIKNKFQEVEEGKEERGGGDYVSAEESAHAEMQGRPNPRIQDIQNQNHLRHLIGGENFRHPQIKDSWRSWYFLLSPDDIEAIWREAREQSDISPLFWFVDVCNGKRARPKREGTEGGSAPPKIRFGDVVFHPEQGEFVADFEALYEDAWRCPEGYFIPSRELQVVRSTDA